MAAAPCRRPSRLARVGACCAGRSANVARVTGCSRCGPSLTPVLAESVHWHVRLNLNQNLLGKLIIVLRRHVERAVELTPDEWSDLRHQVWLMTERLQAGFAPDHFNYAFLQNQDRHVHLHVIPRYAGPRQVAGLRFEDPDYPDHYAVPSPARHLAPAVLDELARRIGRDAAR